MQGYEIVYVLDPNVTEEWVTSFQTKVDETLSTNGGKVMDKVTWGRRKLAYRVKKREYGIYNLLYTDRSPEALKALETMFRYDENLIKWMTVSVEDVNAEKMAFDKLISEGSAAETLTEK